MLVCWRRSTRFGHPLHQTFFAISYFNIFGKISNRTIRNTVNYGQSGHWRDRLKPSGLAEVKCITLSYGWGGTQSVHLSVSPVFNQVDVWNVLTFPKNSFQTPSGKYLVQRTSSAPDFWIKIAPRFLFFSKVRIFSAPLGSNNIPLDVNWTKKRLHFLHHFFGDLICTRSWIRIGSKLHQHMGHILHLNWI